MLALVVAGAAQARTPTPTPVPVSTATPVPPEPAIFSIIPWVNGQNDAHDVTAKIGETTCATGLPITPPPGSKLVFDLSIPSEEAVPGCGREGAVVSFFVDGRQAAQTVIWHSGISQHFEVIVGPPFARFSGGVGPDRLFHQVILSYVGNVSCGDGRTGPQGYGYAAVVYSAEQQAGCGVEGSQVTFKLLDAQGNVIAVANEKATWHAWDGISEPQQLNLTFGPAGVITTPNTGTGDGPARATAPWGPLALALASLGLTGGIAALAFRRRAMTR